MFAKIQLWKFWFSFQGTRDCEKLPASSALYLSELAICIYDTDIIIELCYLYEVPSVYHLFRASACPGKTIPFEHLVFELFLYRNFINNSIYIFEHRAKLMLPLHYFLAVTFRRGSVAAKAAFNIFRIIKYFNIFSIVKYFNIFNCCNTLKYVIIFYSVLFQYLKDIPPCAVSEHFGKLFNFISISENWIL